MFSIYLKEINYFFNSLTAYLVMVVYLAISGLILWIFPETSILESGYADMEVFFTFSPYVFMFLVPAITMKMFAEEKKSGTIEILLTRPLTDYQIIAGKYFASVTLIAFSLLPTSLYYITLYQVGNPAGNLDTPGITGSYLGLFLLGSVFASIGLFSSSITQNQVVAFIAGVFLCFILYDGFYSLSKINWPASYARLFSSLSLASHYNELGKGMIDLRDVLYFLSIIIFMNVLTKLILGSRKWE